MSINRELSQLASFLDVQEDNNFIGISTGGTYTVGIGTSSVIIGSTGIITATQFQGPSGSSLIDRIDLQDEGSPVGTGFTTLNFVGTGVTITEGASGIATVTITGSAIIGTSGEVEVTDNGDGTTTLSLADEVGITSSLTVGTVKIESGIITATSGIVTYNGDGSGLTNINASSLSGIATDSDKLDGQEGSYYLDTSATGQTKAGDLTLSKSGTPNFVVQTSNNSGQDALIKIRGARTLCNTCDIAMLQFDNKTINAYTMAQISAMDPAGDHTDGKGKLVFRTATGGTLSDQVTIMDDGNVGIGTHSPTAKLDVDGTVNVSGVSTFQDNVFLGDNDILYFGDDNDLQIYHDGVNSYISDQGTGKLRILSNDFVVRKTNNTGTIIRGVQNAQVELYYDDDKKFVTTGIGISVANGAGNTATIYGPGNLIIDPAPVDDNGGIVRIKGDLYVDGTTTEINSTTLTIDDLNVVVASGATNGLTADGAGLTVAGAGATIKYNYNGGSEQWVFNKAPYYNTNRLLTTADEGTGNGLDADTLDSEEGTYYLDYANFSGIATDSDKLDGQEGTYYLDYSNFTNTPPDIRWFETAVGIWTSSSVGIGTTNPQTLLHVEKTTQGEIARFRASNDTRYLKISSFDSGFNGSGFDFNATSNAGEISFSTQNVEKVRINNDGNLGIGTDSPLAKLDVRDGSVYVPGGTFDASSLGGGNDSKTDAALVIDRNSAIYVQSGGYLRNLIEPAGTVINIGQQNTSHFTEINLKPGAAGGSVKLHDGGTVDNVKLETTSTGINVTGHTETDTLNVSGIATAQDFNSASDENLKTNIRTIEDPLAKVVQIRGVNFDWKETQRPALGVIAQEIEKVLPELVTDNGTKTVNYNGLIGLLIEAVKAQQEEIDILKSKIK